jgi:hypothetical protein
LPQDDEKRKQLLNTMFRIKAAEFSRCFAPPPWCPEPAVRAHSVQNARALDLIAASGHVVAPTIRLSAAEGPLVDFSCVGRNQATTFSGVCAKHDRDIFAPIETSPLDLQNPEHRFLLAYRATFYEVHATSAAAWQVQTGYLKRTELELDPKDQPSRVGMFAVGRMIDAYETYGYKEALDRAFLERRFESLEHDVVTLEVAEPTIAASTLFSLDHLSRGDDVVRVCLTILPIEQRRTAALFSYLAADASLARAELGRILESSGAYQKYELSRRLLNSCQNFAISPRYVASWSPAKRKVVVDFFVRTVMHDDLLFEDADLTLFL